MSESREGSIQWRAVFLKLEDGARSGVAKGISGYVWLLKILIPLSLLTTILETGGWLSRLYEFIAPVMHLIHLPPSAALPIVAGMLTGVYGGIACMVMLPFSVEQMTLIAIFVLISHNLIQESMIQGQSGLSPLKAILSRVTASIVTAAAAAWFLNPQGAFVETATGAVQGAGDWIPALRIWAESTAWLSVKIFFIIMALMVVMGILRSFNWIPVLVRMLRPMLRLMGLDERVGILWLTAVVFGLSYGAAVIVEEAKEGSLAPRELERLHISIGINHSMVEDPILFATLGLPAFWLWIPRVITAIAAVYVYDGWQKIRLAGNR